MKLSTSLSALAGLTTAAATPLDDTTTSSSPPPGPLDPAHLFQNPDPNFPSSSSSSSAARRIPTSYESAVLGRRILALTPLATLSTVFPASPYATAADEDADGVPRAVLFEHRPAGLGGAPVGLMDYIADCDAALGASGDDADADAVADAGNPTILAIRIATSFRNVDAGSNLSVSVNWVPPYPPRKRLGEQEDEEGAEASSSSSSHRKSGSGGLLPSWAQRLLGRWTSTNTPHAHAHHHHNHHAGDPVPYSAANLPRFSLLGHLEPIALPDPTARPGAHAAAADALAACFTRTHPDARWWLPGNRIHESEWVRLVVDHVYWIGGFGDRAYIGWIPADEWRNVTRAEWEAVRLPGEKPGWSEWSVVGAAGQGEEAGAAEWEL